MGYERSGQRHQVSGCFLWILIALYSAVVFLAGYWIGGR